MPKNNPVELLKAPSKNGMVLKNAQGLRVELTVSHVEALFAELKASLSKVSKEPDPTSSESSAQLLKRISRYGMKTARDFITFLKSKGGESVIAMIGEHQLAELAILQNRRDEDHERRVRRHYIALFLLGMFYKRKARAHHKKEIDEQIQNEQIKNAQEIAKNYQYKPETAPLSRPQYVAQINIKTYINAAKTVLDTKLIEAGLLEEQLEALEQLIQRTDKKFELYNQHIEALANFIPPKLDLKNSARRQQLLEEISAKQKMIADVILDDAKIIQKMLDDGADERIVREMMEVSNAQNIQIGAIADMIDVLNDAKKMFTASGEETLSFFDADFILPTNQPKRIAKIGDTYLLLSATQNIHTLSPSEINKARLEYEKVKTEIMGVKQLLDYNHQLEKKNNHLSRATLSKKAEAMQQDILALVNEITTIQASSADADSLSLPLLQLTPRPTPPLSSSTPRTSQTNSPAPRPSPELFSDSYQHMVRLMRTNPSRQSIDWLNASLENNDQLKPAVSQLKPGKPISEAMMNELLKRPDLGRLWVTAANKSPVMLPTTPKQEAASTAPTPFATKLTPYPRSKRSE